MRALPTILAVAAVAAGCAGSDSAPSAPVETDALVELSTAEQLTQRFDADSGKARLLLILSPT